MPLPNNPYPNKIDLLYTFLVEQSTTLRKRLKPLNLRFFRAIDGVQTVKQKSVANDQP